MKWIIFILCLCGAFPAAAQEFLGQSGREIRQFITGQGSEAVVAGDTVRCDCREEDERGRVFEVAYVFVMEDGVCSTYRKATALHEYWIGVIRELAEAKEGEGVGTAFEAEGEQVFPEYRFEDFRLKVKLEKGMLCMEFDKGGE